jgi:Pup-ligase protein
VAERLLFGVETERLNIALGRCSQDVGPATLHVIAARQPHLPDRTGNGIFLATGGRMYVDCGHVEDCTPECSDPEEIVAYVKVAEKLLWEAAPAVATELGAAKVSFGRANVDYLSNVTFGQHESYLCRNRPRKYLNALTAHLVSRVVYTGAGGLRPEINAPQFAVSPRLLFFTCVANNESTHDRPILNLRDEPHASGWSRLHIIAGETLSSELGLYLKVGVTALIVRVAELIKPAAYAHLQLKDPVDALHKVSLDTTCAGKLALRDGRRLTAIEIQRSYLDLVAAHFPQLPEWANAVCNKWATTLDALEAGPELMQNMLDWPLKLRIYGRLLGEAEWRACGGDLVCEVEAALRKTALHRQRTLQLEKLLLPSSPVLETIAQLNEDLLRRGLRWDRINAHSSDRQRLIELDMRFGIIGEGIFDALDRQGLLRHRIVSDEQVSRAMQTPPAETRARLRGQMVGELAGRGGGWCGWTSLLDRNRSKVLDLCDPWAGECSWRDQDAGEDLVHPLLLEVS